MKIIGGMDIGLVEYEFNWDFVNFVQYYCFQSIKNKRIKSKYQEFEYSLRNVTTFMIFSIIKLWKKLFWSKNKWNTYNSFVHIENRTKSYKFWLNMIISKMHLMYIVIRKECLYKYYSSVPYHLPNFFKLPIIRNER